jgi:radical SAM enzyme (TIGR01210 family)
MARIRNSANYAPPGLPSKAKNREIWQGRLDGYPANRLIIYLRSSACGWVLGGGKKGKFSAGCLDCEHSLADTTYGKPISAEDYIAQFRGEFNASEPCPILCLYNEGSFFNEQELPPEARRRILTDIAESGYVNRLILESLPGYLTDDLLEETIKLLGSVELEIGIGLESSDDTIRDLCVNKPFNLGQFEAAAKIVNRHCDLLTYVLLKPSFLTEREAMNNAMSTAKYAFDIGSNAVSIEPVGIGKYTMSGMLEKIGLYKKAWLWTVLECATSSFRHGETRIGGHQFSPYYETTPKNCRLCSVEVEQGIKQFNQTNDITCLTDLKYTCCSEAWKDRLAEEAAPLPLRVKDYIQRVNRYLDENQPLFQIIGAGT